MKNSKAILLAIFTSVFAVLTVVNMSLTSPKSAGENALDMLEIMTRAFDESEGGEDPIQLPDVNVICSQYPTGETGGRCWDPTDCENEWTPFGGFIRVQACINFSGLTTDLCVRGFPCGEPS